MTKLERKLGKYAIPNLSLILIICYGVGYLIQLLDRNQIITQFICLNPVAICRGQVWRLITWVLVPPSSFDFFTIIMLLFYYSIGHTLEQVWGDYWYNVYIFSGMLFTIVGSFLLMGWLKIFPNELVTLYGMDALMQQVGISVFSTYYVNMSIFLAFACTFPDNRVLLMFFIPIKIKWLGIAYGALLIYEVIAGSVYSRFAIVASLLNFVVFFLISRGKLKGSPKDRIRQIKRQREFRRETKTVTPSGQISKHKCAICGRTELTNPELQFRFCSKCNGNYEYCNNHLFTHVHIEQ